jgi:hypothetical protein
MVPPENLERAAARQDMGVILINHLGRPEEGLEALREAARLERDPGRSRLLDEEIRRIEKQKRP